jgi:tRNA-dihydrouridine synthase B
VEGVKIAEAAGADVIDLNMGCPAKRVTNGYAGSALMRELDLAARLIEATVAAARVPVTLKMRLGWDDGSLNAPELAKRAEAAGVVMVTVHGRTRCQFYSGRANWSAIRAVKDAVSIPVVANGDLDRPEQAAAMLTASGADAVMIGRGAYGQPWIVGATGSCLNGAPPAAAPRGTALVALALEHYEMMLAYYGVGQGLRVARKHLGWYLDRFASGLPQAQRRRILTESDWRTVAALLPGALDADREALAA